MTNDQLDGVLKAGDVLRVRGLWRSNNGSKKENIQSNSQKVDRDKREQPPIAGQIQKIKLVQPTQEKNSDNVQQPVTSVQQQSSQSSGQSHQKSADKNAVAERSSDDGTSVVEPKKVHEENRSNESSGKNKENLEANGKKRKSVSSDVDSTKSQSEGGENVSKCQQK